MQKLDLRDVYLQMPLSEASKDLTTVSTYWGLLRMKGFPFGLARCGDVFQVAMDRILGLPECVSYLDDLLVMGTSAKDLVEKLDKVLGRLKDDGIRLKKTKCEFSLQEVRYLGWIVTSSELKPIPEKTEAMRRLPNSTDVPTLGNLLGAVGYYSRLLPHLSRNTNTIIRATQERS